MKKITVLIINYNSSTNTNKLVKSLNKIDKYINKILIIDNNSSDIKKLKHTSKTNLVINKTNNGFAKAVNQGIKLAKSEFIFLTNPDSYLENDSILKSLEKISKDERVGAIGGKIRKPNSNKYHLTATSKPNFLTGLFEFTNLKKLFPNNSISKDFWIEKSKKITKPTEVNSLCGAYIILRKKINNKLNLFDERYFMYLEDIDFGDNINENGYKVIFDPESEIIHIGGASSNSKYRSVLRYWYTSRKKYFQKHLNPICSSILIIIFTLEEQFLKIYHKIKSEPYE